MKLGSLKDGSRDGALAIVDLTRGVAVRVPHIAATLQAAIDNWSEAEPKLRATAARLARGELEQTMPVDTLTWQAPLSRAYQLLDGGGYKPHLELGYRLRKQEFPKEMEERPGFYQSVSDSILNPDEDILLEGNDLGPDFEAELAVVTADVGQGTRVEHAGQNIILLGLMNDVSLRLIQRVEFARGFGFYHCKPKKAFAPFFVTPDEIAPHWKNFKLALPVEVKWNGKVFGCPDGAEDMMFDFATLVSEASRHRRLAAGTIVGGGTVASWDRASKGHCCIHERRVLDLLEFGEERTPWLQPNDNIAIEVRTPDGATVFGAINQRYRAL